MFLYCLSQFSTWKLTVSKNKPKNAYFKKPGKNFEIMSGNPECTLLVFGHSSRLFVATLHTVVCFLIVITSIEVDKEEFRLFKFS